VPALAACLLLLGGLVLLAATVCFIIHETPLAECRTAARPDVRRVGLRSASYRLSVVWMSGAWGLSGSGSSPA
jgi:hypothetical protein